MEFDKIASGAAYGSSSLAVINGLLSSLSSEAWSALGVLTGIIVAITTCGVNWYYQHRKMKAMLAVMERTGNIVNVDE